MRVEVHSSAQAFLEATEQVRAQTPAITSVMGSVAAGVVAGRGYEREFWYTVVDESDVVVACAMRTAPHNLTVSDMPEAAAAALAEVVRELDSTLPGIAGPRTVVEQLVQALGLHERMHMHMEDVVRVLGDLTPPRLPVAGSARPALPTDADLLERWFIAFAAESGAAIDAPRVVAEHGIAEGRFALWCVDDVPVALGGHAPLASTPSGSVGRIGSIYTDPSQRGHGYGSAITHHVAQLLQRRCSTVLLYADAANATSNHIYADLGFEAVAEIVEMVLDDPSGV